MKMMKGIMAGALAAVPAGVTPAPAHAENTYYVRNASRTPIMCRLSVTRGGAYYLVTIRPGQGVRQTFESGGERQLACSTHRFSRTVFRIRPGPVYELIETSGGALRLRTATPR